MMTLTRTINKTRIDGYIMENIAINKGVRKRDLLSTVLFNFVLETILRESGSVTNDHNHKIKERIDGSFCQTRKYR